MFFLRRGLFVFFLQCNTAQNCFAEDQKRTVDFQQHGDGVLHDQCCTVDVLLRLISDRPIPLPLAFDHQQFDDGFSSNFQV